MEISQIAFVVHSSECSDDNKLRYIISSHFYRNVMSTLISDKKPRQRRGRGAKYGLWQIN